MKYKEKVFIISFAMIAGFLGGFISNQLFITKSAFATNKPKPQKVVTAEKFVAVNKKGQVCATLEASVDKDGNPRAEFRMLTEETGKSRVILSAGAIGTDLRLYGPHDTSASIVAHSIGPTLSLYGPQDSNAYIMAHSIGPTLSLYGPQDTSASIGVDPMGVGLNLYGPRGMSANMLINKITDYASLTLISNETFNPNIALSTRQDETVIKLLNGKGNPRVTIGNESLVTKKTDIVEKRPISSIVLFNEKGDVLWAVP